MNEVTRLKNLLDDVREAKNHWVDILNDYEASRTLFVRYKKEIADCKARIETYSVMECWLKTELWTAQLSEEES